MKGNWIYLTRQKQDAHVYVMQFLKTHKKQLCLTDSELHLFILDFYSILFTWNSFQMYIFYHHYLIANW